MSFRLGLTGSIGMGKSTTAGMFAEEGVPIWDADAVVHRLYEPGQAAALAIGTLFPGAVDPDGRVNRPKLRAMIQADPTVLDQLNAAVTRWLPKIARRSCWRMAMRRSCFWIFRCCMRPDLRGFVMP